MLKHTQIAASLKHQRNKYTIARLPEGEPIKELMPYFMQHQVDWILDRSPLAINVKGRRTGISYAESGRAVLDCIANNFDTFYSTYSLESTRSFIGNCAKFARIANVAATHIVKTMVIDDEEVQTQSLVFRNGRKIQAIPGNPVNVRDRQGVLVIDEAAFRKGKNLKEVMDASYAIQIWGGMIRVISTHFGVKNEFNLLIKDVEQNPEKGTIHFTPFKKAVANGLYKRICALKGKIWTQADEDEWVRLLYVKAGDSALQEYDAIPTDYASGSIFPKENWKFVDYNYSDYSFNMKLRSFDLANTDKEVAKKTHFYSATIKAVCNHYNQLVILDWDTKQVSDDKGDQWIEDLSYQDGANTMFLIELEGGSEASKYISYMKRRLTNVTVKEIPPQKNKLLRALPCVPLISEGSVVIDRNMKNIDEFLDLLDQFNGEKVPKITDLADGLSQLISFWQRTIYVNG